jgi:hypothetical protein
MFLFLHPSNLVAPLLHRYKSKDHNTKGHDDTL